MRLVIVLEQRFVHTPDGAAYTDGPATYALWARYLEVFEEVLVLGRSRPVAAAPPEHHRADGPGVRVAPLPYYLGPEQFLLRWWPLRRALERCVEREDAVILRVAGTLANLTEAVLCRRGQPFGVEVVNDPREVFGGGSVRHPLRRAFRTLFTRAVRRQCREAVAVQYVTRSRLQRAYPPAPGRPGFGVSDVFLPPEAYASAPRRYHGPARRAVLVGSLAQWYKGPHIALRALAALRAEGLDLHLTLVGDGRLRPEVEALVRQLGLGEAATLVGQRGSPAAVRADLLEAELFLMPSYAEGMPRALLEAMAQGLPAIASRVGGIPEVLPDECLVEPGSVEGLTEAWRALASDPARLTQQSARNLALAHEYADARLSERRSEFLRAVRAGSRP